MLERNLIEKLLAKACERGADFAEVYCERSNSKQVRLQDRKLDMAQGGQVRGVGIRVVKGDITGYAHSDDLSEAALLKAAEAASAVSTGGESRIVALEEKTYPSRATVEVAPSDFPVEKRIEKVREIHEAMRAKDERIAQVMVVTADMDNEILIANTEGLLARDRRAYSRVVTVAVAAENGVRQSGTRGCGDTNGMDLLLNGDVVQMGLNAVDAALEMLKAKPSPAGEMPVVLSSGWGGVLFHEACGHGLEADFNHAGTSIYSNRIGEQVASELVTAIDDGTVHGRRGSFAMDDEGHPSQKTVLFDKGVLTGYLHDRKSSLEMNLARSGNGRRESYRHLPMPRMTNTYIAGGESDPEEIIRATKKGLFARSLGGGTVDIARGEFVFSVTEAYLIEDGKLTRPVSGATLIGNGPEVMKLVDMVGNDCALDPGIGTCGKYGQSVPVCVGQPTLRVKNMVVGGTNL